MLQFKRRDTVVRKMAAVVHAPRMHSQYTVVVVFCASASETRCTLALTAGAAYPHTSPFLDITPDLTADIPLQTLIIPLLSHLLVERKSGG